MDINTHEQIDRALCGEPVAVVAGSSEVRLTCSPNMAADASGLVHGGFIFGMADYAAMLAVNHPNVVLAGAESRFLKPSKVGDVLIAKAQEQEKDGRKHIVKVEVFCNEDKVFSATFTCFVTKEHVLTGA
ncbi:PaaI family thioesterase [Desulfovibrio sp. JC010]|uniref:PaaI family thioesterase n=1 Tax=Desulfovibrio sp. JC010 TaxID=2593641 RepID=UPI0013CF8EF6|nr:PaaI family thioesterase [Desulfovibrio sp. JC010]NDV26038.1 PaaI family thioesterase [Desulfovibrio sp. JC010]